MAGGYARHGRRVAACIATAGPGATNLITGIANAFLDSVPVVAITGQVPTGLMGTDAFQEVDIFGMTMPIVKHSFLVRRVEDIASTTNVAADHPEIVARLTRLAEAARADLGDRGQPGAGQRTIGRVENPTPRVLGAK